MSNGFDALKSGAVRSTAGVVLGGVMMIGSGASAQPLDDAVRVLEPTVKTHRLVVKFRDGFSARDFRDGLAAAFPLPIDDPVSVMQRDHAAEFTSLIPISDRDVNAIQSRTSVARGMDLRSLVEVNVEALSMLEAAELLRQSDAVEVVSIEQLLNEPPCVDVYPQTIDFNVLQQYKGSGVGINVAGLQQEGWATGAGVSVGNVEYFFNPDHEDLCSVAMPWTYEIPSFVFDNGWDDHGTASLGVVVAQDNGYGVTGIVPHADAAFFPEFTVERGSNRAYAISRAAAFLEPGDVLMLEMQTANLSGGYGPAELDFSVWAATKAAVDAGITVVAAAGNGNRDLDDSLFSTWQGWGDSGAILVGAGSADAQRDKLSFSTYGSRVNLQGWGEQVATLGYGTLFEPDENQTYTGQFNGTSSATPIVAGAAAALQSYTVRRLGVVLDPAELREVLIATGDAQGSGGHIGPRPNVGAASEYVFEHAGCYIDITGDGVVDIDDLLGVLSRMSGVFVAGPSDADFNRTGEVDIEDLLTVLAFFGRECP